MLNMNVVLPDPALTDVDQRSLPLSWVGMEGIDLPISLFEPIYARGLHAHVDAVVDLPLGHVKGIHMSRLYRLLNDLATENALSPRLLRRTLQAMIESQQDCGTRRARLRLAFSLLVQRPALITPSLSGWKSYPVVIEATLSDGVFLCSAQVEVGYSSTCPCSAALSRQLIEQAFLQEFGQEVTVTSDQVASWLRLHASAGTPHSQRSRAIVRVGISEVHKTFGLLPLINQVEHAVGTPLQTAVKRADEQAFAALNGQNLMFVEDAVRRIKAALDDYPDAHVNVHHLESLHPHDAVAQFEGMPL